MITKLKSQKETQKYFRTIEKSRERKSFIKQKSFKKQGTLSISKRLSEQRHNSFMK